MNKTLKVSSYLAGLMGIILVVGGTWGLVFTYQNVVQEHITTPEDASLPGRNVTGPFTLKSQADIIREHTLKITNGKTYAEMPRQVQKTDEAGNLVVDKDGKPVMIDNATRNIWVTATTLTTALNLGIVTYVFSTLVILIGLISLWNSYLFSKLARKFEI